MKFIQIASNKKRVERVSFTVKICRDGPTIGVGSYSTPTDMNFNYVYCNLSILK